MTLIKRKRAPSVLVHVDLLLIVHALLMFGTHAFLTPQSASLLRISSHTIEVNNRATSRIARTNMQDKFRGKEQENQKLKVPRKRNVRIPDWLQGKEPSEKGTSRKSRTPVSFMKRSLRKVRGIIDDDEHSGWLSWMSGVGGTPRGVEEIKLREPVELGGIARSDRYASRDWFHNTLNLHSSAVLRDIRNPVISLTCWATFISLLHRSVLAKSQIMANRMCLHPQPHSLMVSTLGLLLVFKTNSAYQRFKEGREIWEDIINNSRDLSRMIVLYEDEIGIEKRKRIQFLLAAFPYLLRHRIRPDLVMRRLDDQKYERDPENSILLYRDAAAYDNDSEAAAVAEEEEATGMSRRKTRPLYWVDKRTLPWRLLPEGALQKCARAQNRPLWVADRMAMELKQVADQPTFTARERMTLITIVGKLSNSIGACERIHQTVVPLNYARHSLRSLTVWLLSLPFALVQNSGLLTGPVLFVVSWLLFGVYEIGYSIEDPFQGTLRLSILCDTIRRDIIGDEMIRGTAFQLDPEPGADHDTKADSNDEDDYDYEDGYEDTTSAVADHFKNATSSLFPQSQKNAGVLKA